LESPSEGISGGYCKLQERPTPIGIFSAIRLSMAAFCISSTLVMPLAGGREQCLSHLIRMQITSCDDECCAWVSR